MIACQNLIKIRTLFLWGILFSKSIKLLENNEYNHLTMMMHIYIRTKCLLQGTMGENDTNLMCELYRTLGSH